MALLLWSTFPYIPWKIPERINAVIFSEFFWVVASENTPGDKNMFKVDNKVIFQECLLDVFIISLENIF